jgi:hypothetical protein
MNSIASAHYVGIAYILYFAASIGLTMWIARTLFRHGEVFLEDVFDSNPRMANAVNRLLVVGFYLLNLGYAFVTLRGNRLELTAVEAIEMLAMKLGALMIALGVIHFLNLYLFYRIRRRGQIRLAAPPVRPQAHLDGNNRMHPSQATPVMHPGQAVPVAMR